MANPFITARDKYLQYWARLSLARSTPTEAGASDYAWPGRNPANVRYSLHIRYLRRKWFLNLDEWAQLVADELNAGPHYHPNYWQKVRFFMRRCGHLYRAQRTESLIISCADARRMAGLAPTAANPLSDSAAFIDQARLDYRKQDYSSALKNLSEAYWPCRGFVISGGGTPPQRRPGAYVIPVIYWAEALIYAEMGKYYQALHSAQRLANLNVSNFSGRHLKSLPGYIRALTAATEQLDAARAKRELVLS